MCFTVQLSRFLSFLRQPYQITIIRKACQELFYFFETFFSSCFRLFLSFSTASLDYHILLGLSRTFLKFFNFFKNFFEKNVFLCHFDSLFTLSYLFFLVNNFFHFLKIYCCYPMLSSQKFKLSFLSQQQLVQNSTSNIVCQLFFYFFQKCSLFLKHMLYSFYRIPLQNWRKYEKNEKHYRI